MKIIEVDDCVRLVNISNHIVLNYSLQSKPEDCDPTFKKKGPCDAGNWSLYADEEDFIVRDYEYEFMTGIEITIEDWNRLNGYMAIDAYINEYIIKYSDQTFWECKNCYNSNNEFGKFDYGYQEIWKNGINYHKDVFKLHPPSDKNECGPDLYTFVFKINDINDLYKGGKNGPFETIPNFYSFPNVSQLTFERNITYSEGDLELELINFNLENIINTKSNDNLVFNNNDFIYKICDTNMEGQLKGLDSNGVEKNINKNDSFKCTEDSGLNYKLGTIEKEGNYTEVRLTISVYKNCPEDTTVFKFCSREAIIEQKEFIFKINIIRPPTDTTKETELSSSVSNSSINIEILDCLDGENYISHDEKNGVYSHLCQNFTKNKILDNLNEVVNKIEENKTYKIIGKDFIAHVLPIDYLDENNTNNNNDIFSNSSHTNFTECEKTLRDHYNITSPRKITFIQVELSNTNDDVLVNQIEYKAYDDTQRELNLSLCNNTNLTVYYILKNEKQEEVDLISYFKKNGVDILDLNDKFFNDVCMPYSNSENDLTLNDRIRDIYKNYSFCEKNCRLVEINFDEYKATCDCTIKEDMNVDDFNFDISEALTQKKNNNFQIIKCYSGFTSIKDNLANIGFWIFLGLMLLNILLLILYICGLKTIKNYISKEMANHGYIGNASHAFCHNYVKQLDNLIQRLNRMKNDFIKKKEPPKRRTRKKFKKSAERRGLINAKNSQINNSKEIMGKRIEILKAKMDKTKRVNKFQSTKDVILKGSKNENNIQIENNNFQLNLININVNEVKKNTYIPNVSGQILNIYNFKEAIQHDKRSLFTIYYIFLIAKQVIMHAFFYRSPIEPLSIRLSLLKFMLGCDLALNAIFYTDDKVSERYKSAKSAISFAFTNNLSVILLSILIGYSMFIFLGNLNNSTNQIRNLFREEEEKIKNNKKYVVSLPRKKEIICEVKRIMRNYKIKVIIFYIIEFVCMIFFWYYVTIFCNIYKKTQLSWLLDCLLTIIIRIVIDFLLNLILALLYILSIGLKSNCLYRVMIFFYCFS